MNVQVDTSTRAWTDLEGHAVNGVFPLRRLLGSSDHSGVFLIDAAKQEPRELAVKLVPATPALAQSCLPRWRTALKLSHPHLIRLFRVGLCEVAGSHYLYALMEYSDQNLAELLERRALTEDETREMLAPTLSALAFLHEQDFVQGNLKPSNVLVVGDQLKLASDTIHRVGDMKDKSGAMSAYDPPEAGEASCSTAADIWALGVTLCEALTRRKPSGLQGDAEIVLPAELPAAFKDIVASCLKRNPHERIDVVRLQASAHGNAAPVQSTAEPAKVASPEPVTAQIAAAPPPAVTDTAPREAPAKRRILLLALGVVLAAVLIWVGVRMLMRDPAPPVVEPAESVSSQPPTVAAGQPISVTPAKSQDSNAPLVVVHEEIPNAPQSALRTIRGTVRVSIRVIVDNDGTVFAALADDPGPSRYFERLALEAAKRWTFAPANPESDQRVAQIRFAFTRDGVTARMVPLP